MDAGIQCAGSRDRRQTLRQFWRREGEFFLSCRRKAHRDDHDQGFLRRVHRWPVLADTGRPVGHEKNGSTVSGSANGARHDSDPMRSRGRFQDVQPTISAVGAEVTTFRPANGDQYARRVSAAQTSLELLRSRETKPGDSHPARTRGHRSDSIATVTSEYNTRKTHPIALPIHAMHGVSSSPTALARLSPDIVNSIDIMDGEHSSGGRSALGVSRPRLSRSPSVPLAALQAPGPPYPPDLLTMLDGEHHTDEICTRFEVGWPTLQRWLRTSGGGSEAEEDYGRICLIYR